MADESTNHNVVESNPKSQEQTFQAVGEQVQRLALDENPSLDEYQRQVVPTEVIDSLCMNCGQDVRFIPLSRQKPPQILLMVVVLLG